MIITTNDIKAILGITTTNYDAVIPVYNEAAEELLNSLLGVTNLLVHNIEFEEVGIDNEERIIVNDFPLNVSTLVIYDLDRNEITGYTFKQVNNYLRTAQVLDSESNYSTVNYDRILASYTAGYADIDAVPSSLKIVNAYMVGGMIAEQNKQGGIKSLKIDDKTVTFATEGQADFAQNIINKYASQFKRVNFRVI